MPNEEVNRSSNFCVTQWPRWSEARVFFRRLYVLLYRLYVLLYMELAGSTVKRSLTTTVEASRQPQRYRASTRFRPNGPTCKVHPGSRWTSAARSDWDRSRNGEPSRVRSVRPGRPHRRSTFNGSSTTSGVGNAGCCVACSRRSRLIQRSAATRPPCGIRGTGWKH